VIYSILSSAVEDTVVHEFATLCLASLSVDFVCKVQIFDNNGLPPVIQLLSSPDPDVKKNSLETIFNLVQVSYIHKSRLISSATKCITVLWSKVSGLLEKKRLFLNSLVLMYVGLSKLPDSTSAGWDPSTCGAVKVRIPSHSASVFKDTAEYHYWQRCTEHL